MGRVKDFQSVNQEESKPISVAAPSSIKVTINEKEGALPGNRVRAVGMCFYKPVKDLVTDRTNRLCRNPDNPKDTSCIEVRDRQRVRATLNKSVSSLLASYFDEGSVREPTW